MFRVGCNSVDIRIVRIGTSSVSDACVSKNWRAWLTASQYWLATNCVMTSEMWFEQTWRTPLTVSLDWQNFSMKSYLSVCVDPRVDRNVSAVTIKSKLYKVEVWDYFCSWWFVLMRDWWLWLCRNERYHWLCLHYGELLCVWYQFFVHDYIHARICLFLNYALSSARDG